MILVVGATGLVGGQICERLVKEGNDVRALVRATSDPEKVAALTRLGVTTVIGDLRDRASLDAACAGVDAVITTASSMPFAYDPGVNDIDTTDLQGELNLIEAAKAAGVGHFVYTSFSRNLDLDFPLQHAKRTVERHLIDSGMPYTILRPSCFMEVWLSPAVGFDPAHSTVTVYGDGTRPVSYIASRDVADFAVLSLTVPLARNAVLELGGPEALTPLQAADVFAEALGTEIALTFVPESALVEQQAGTTDGMQQSFSGLMRCVARGDEIDMGAMLAAFPVSLTSVKEFATGG